MPAGRGLAPLADIPDSEPGHGPPELVIRRKNRRIDYRRATIATIPAHADYLIDHK
jgi:hypothetical protein